MNKNIKNYCDISIETLEEVKKIQNVIEDLLDSEGEYFDIEVRIPYHSTKRRVQLPSCASGAFIDAFEAAKQQLIKGVVYDLNVISDDDVECDKVDQDWREDYVDVEEDEE